MITELQQKILDEHQELSSLPQTLAEVLRVIRNSDSSARDIAGVLMKDPGLTAKLLRLANSPYFGAGRKISSVTHAVMTMGLRATTALVLSASIYDLTGHWEGTLDRLRFWRHSLSVAIAAREIAEKINHECPEEAFVCGLLHDLGLLVLEKSFPERFLRLWELTESGENLLSAEEHHWGTNHARVGQFLLEQWQLPESICRAVGKHHDQFSTDDFSTENQLPQVVALANIITPYSMTKVRLITDETLLRKEMLSNNLKLSEGLTDIEERISELTSAEAHYLDIDIGTSEDMLTEANRMLFRQYLTVEKLLRENRAMQEKIARARLEKAALKTIKTITATFNHYINNAIGTILGRAQLVQENLKRGNCIDKTNDTERAMDVIIKGVQTISSVMDELINLSSFETTVYHDDTYIIDIEKRIKERVEELEKISVVS